MDGERKENPKEALNAGDSTKSSEANGASSRGFEKPVVGVPETKSEIKMQQSDVKEIKSTVPHTETAIKESETDVKELKIATDGLKTDSESSVNELKIPLKENNNPEVKKSQTVVTALKDLAQKAAGSVKDAESAIKEPKGVQSIDRGAKTETSISTTENPETDLVTKFETNIKESIVLTSGTKDVIKETETEIKDCTKKDSDSVVETSDPGVKESKKEDEAKVKQTDTQAEDIKIISENFVSEAKSSKQFEEPMDVSVESDDCRTDDEKKNNEMAMEIDATEGSLKESKSEDKAQRSDSTCSETVVQDSSTEVSEMECSDFDNSCATIVISDADTSIEKSDGVVDILLTKEKQPASKVESKGEIKNSQTELKDTESNNSPAPVDNTNECMIVESIRETNNKVKEMQTSVEKIKIAPEVSKSEINKMHESQKLTVQPKDELKVKENKMEETVKTLKESVKTETFVHMQSSETDAVQSQNKVSKMDKDVLKPRSADTVIADVQHATPDSENSKSIPEVQLKKAESSVTTALAAKPASVSEEQKKLTKMELLKPVIDNNASTVSKEQKKLPERDLIKSGDEKARDSSAVSKTQKKLPEVELVKSGDEKTRDSSGVSKVQKKLPAVELIKPGNEKTRDSSGVSKEQKKLPEVELVKPGDEKTRDSSGVSKAQKKLPEVELVKPNGEKTRDSSGVSKEQKKFPEVELTKPDDKITRDPSTVSKEQKKLTADGGDKASKNASTVSKEQKKLTEKELVKSSPDGGDQVSKDTSAVSKEQKKLTEVEHVKLDSGNKASRDAPTILKEEKKLVEIEHVKPDGGDKASRGTSAVLKEQKKLTGIKPDNDITSVNTSVSKEQKKLIELELIKSNVDDKTSRDVSAVSKEQKSHKMDFVKPVSGDTACRSASKEQKKLTEMELATPKNGNKDLKDVQPASVVPEKEKFDEMELSTQNSDSAVSKDVQAASCVSEVPKKLAEVEATKPENAKTVIKDVQHTEDDLKQLDKSDLIKSESDHVVTMDVQCSSSVSEESKKLVAEKEVKSQSAKTVSVDVKNTSVKMLAEPDIVKSDGTTTMDVQPISPASEESQKLPEAELVKTESSKTINMDIQLTAPGSEELKKLDQQELVKPDIKNTLSIKVQSTSAVSEEVNLSKPVSTFTADTKEPKRFAKTELAKPEEANSATMKIQNTAAGTEEPQKLTKTELVKMGSASQVAMDIQSTAAESEELKKLTKVELAKLEGASPMSKDIQNAETNTNEPQKLTEMEVVKPQNVDKVALGFSADSKEQKRLSETECMKSTGMKHAPKEKSEAGELTSVKGVEEQILEKLSETEKAVSSKVSKIDNELAESISKGSKGVKLQEEEDEEEIVIHIDDDNEDRTSDVVEMKKVSMEKGKNEDSTKEAEECGSDDTYCSRASSATPELYMTQESELEVSGTNVLTDSEPDMFASQSQAEDLDNTATPPYKEFASVSQHKGRAIKSSSTLEAELQGKRCTSVKRKLETSDSSDAPESSLPPRKEPKVDNCDTEEEEKVEEEEDDIVPASVPEPKPGDIIKKSASPELSETAVSGTEGVLEAKEVHNSPKVDRKRPAEEMSPIAQCKLTFEGEPQKEPVSVRKKLKLNADESENEVRTRVSDNPEVEVLEPKKSRKSIEVVYMKQASSQWSSTPTGQKERLEKVEETMNMETEDEEVKDELSDSQDLVLRLSLSPSPQIGGSLKAMSPTLSNSMHKSETVVSNAETPEEALQKESSNGHMKSIVEVEEPKSSSEQQNGDSCTVIDIEKEAKVKLSEKLKRKRGDTPVIEIHGSDSECDNTKTPDDKKRKRTENGHKDTPPLPLPVHLVKDTHPETSYNEETFTYVKKVTLDVLLKVEVSKQGNKIMYQGVEQCKVTAEDDNQSAVPGVSDLSSGNLADTSATGSPSSTVSGPGPFALPNNRLSIMTTSSSSSGGSSTALGVTRGRTISNSDVGLFSAPSLGRILKAGKDSFQSDVGVGANKRIEHMDVIEDVLISLVDVENDVEKRARVSKVTETCIVKESIKEVEKKNFCDAFTTMDTSPAQMEEENKVAEEEQVEERVPTLQETPKATKKRFASRLRSTTQSRSVSAKNTDNTDKSASPVIERRKSKEQTKEEIVKNAQEVVKRSTRSSGNSSHSEEAQGTKSKEAPLKRSTRKQSNSEASENTDDSKAATDLVKRVTRQRSDSNVSLGESKEKSTPTPTRSSRKRSSSGTPETRDGSKEPKARQMAVSISKRSTRNRNDSSFTESTEETKGSSRTSSNRSSLEMQDNTSSKAATPFTPKSERKKEKEAALPQTPEHASPYTLKELKPGLAVFAKWTDRKYYSAKLKELQTDKRWVVEFDDGKSKPLLEDYIIAVDQLLKGQLVYAMNEEEEYIHGIIKNVEKRGRKESYTVELDEGETVTVARKELFMTEDQAKILRENVVTTPVKTTPHRLTELTLDNVLEGKRRSKTNLDSSSQSPSTSGLNKKAKAPSSASSEIESASGVEYVDGVQRESTGHVVSRRVKGQGTGNPKKNVDDYGAMPKEGSNIFKGKCFLITSTDAPPIQATAKQDDSVNNTTEDDDSAAADEYVTFSIPFSKAHLTQQIRVGGGTVYNKFEDVPPSEYRNCFLISNRPNLTAKYILCLVNNIPIVSHGWIFKCCKTNKLESYTHHLLPAGWSVTENKYVEIKKKRRSFSNMKIGLVSDSKYFLKFWETVLKTVGASVLRIPPEGVNKQMKLHVIISNNSCPFEVQKQAKDLNIAIVSTMWVVQCLINGTQVAFDYHPHFSYDHSFSD